MDSPNVTSSLELGAGQQPSDSPVGPMIDMFGQALPHVSHSARQAKAKAPPTSATSGQPSTASSASAALTSSLASRLTAALPVNGSMEFTLTWKEADTPLGRRFSLLRASARRTEDIASTGGLPWPTPSAADATGGPGRSPKRRGGDNLRTAVLLTPWGTPRATDAKCGTTYTENCTGKDLAKDASLTAWSTPRAEERMQQNSADNGCALSRQVIGTTSESSDAPTANFAGYRLNPRFSLWLMGLPGSWIDAGLHSQRSLRASETPSVCPSPPSSSPPSTMCSPLPTLIARLRSLASEATAVADEIEKLSA